MLHHSFQVVGLDTEVMNVSSQGVLGRLGIKMHPSFPDADENIPDPGHLQVGHCFSSEALGIELDAPPYIRGEKMDMMNMANQRLSSFLVTNSS
jgi:hypothetical protein